MIYILSHILSLAADRSYHGRVCKCLYKSYIIGLAHLRGHMPIIPADLPSRLTSPVGMRGDARARELPCEVAILVGPSYVTINSLDSCGCAWWKTTQRMR